MPILKIIESLAATGSRNEKEAILKANYYNETLKNVFFFAYNPTIKYFIRKIPNYTPYYGDTPLSLTWAIGELLAISRRFVTGNDAIERLKNVLERVSPRDAVIVERIIESDLKCGATDSTANKVWKGLIPEFPYMRCALPKDAKFNKWKWKKGAYSQLKADSMFANIDVLEDTVIITSRNGSEMPADKFPDIVSEALKYIKKSSRLTGELQVEKDGKILPREIGNGILNSVLKGGDFGPGERPVYSAWDIIPLEKAIPNGEYDVPYSDRFDDLKDMLSMPATKSIQLIPTRIVYSLEEAYEHYFELIALGYEGTVVKNPEGTWFDGTSRDQIKLKVEFECDLKIVGFKPGNGKNEKTFGSIQCFSSDDILDVNVSGFTDKQREEIWADRDNVLGKIMTVKSNMILPADKNGIRSLFLPRHVEIREDKTEADSLARVIEQFEAVVKPKTKE